MQRVPYVCPDTHEQLIISKDGLLREDGKLYPFLPIHPGRVGDAPDFIRSNSPGENVQASLAMYDTASASEVYRNFLDWLFKTFRQDAAAFRVSLVEKLRLGPGARVVVTGCGLGDDIPAILDRIGPEGEVYAQDLSPAMIIAAAAAWGTERAGQAPQVHFSSGDALKLPFPDGVFDAAFHFGGINLFDDIDQGLKEMARVVRPGGRIVVGDEGIGPWLRDTDFGRMVVTNNRLWAHPAPIECLPDNATEVNLSWVLGNCFWLVDFTVSHGLPVIDPHVVHKGWRGGSMWTRHMGQLEAVTPETRQQVIRAAREEGVSVHDWLERALRERLSSDPAGTATHA